MVSASLLYLIAADLLIGVKAQECIPPPKKSTTTSTSSAHTSTYKLSTSTSITTTKASFTTSSSSSSSSLSTTTTAATTPIPNVKYAGVNIGGFSFGCLIDGTCNLTHVRDAAPVGLYHIQHFTSKNGLNAFRLPVSWQYLTNKTLGGEITNLDTYGKLVSNCLSVSKAALCIIDVHNYARYEGQLIGSAAVPTAAFLDLWTKIVAKWGSNPRIAFGIMNEPHDLPNLGNWVSIVQATVTTIRQAGATQNMILLPGTTFSHASTFISDASAAALAMVRNPDGSTDNLVFDIHQYLDSNNSGTNAECTVDTRAYFVEIAAWLRARGRFALLTETGGGPNDPGCLDLMCKQLWTIRENADVFLGWLGWAAGAFSASYILSETPTSGVNQPLVAQCIAGVFEAS